MPKEIGQHGTPGGGGCGQEGFSAMQYCLYSKIKVYNLPLVGFCV